MNEYDLSGSQFERKVRQEINDVFPHTVLSNIPVFSLEVNKAVALDQRGNQIDHLLHLNTSQGNVLIIIECKCPAIFGSQSRIPPSNESDWIAFYYNETTRQDIPKNIDRQLRKQAQGLASYVKSITQGPLRIECWIVSKTYIGPTLNKHYPENIDAKLFSFDHFKEYLKAHLEKTAPKRIEQSALLSEIKKGMRDEDVGHPTIEFAISHINNCRSAIDHDFYKEFSPTERYWAINGAAGMGKSVLLAYTLFVLSTNKIIKVDSANPIAPLGLEDWNGLKPNIGHRERIIYATAKREKQVRILETLWQRFCELSGDTISIQKPIFQVWNGRIPDECNILIIDEAHDLDPLQHKIVADWTNDVDTHYLAIACDRHQRLRLIGPKATIIEGLNFGLHTKRLSRNYRNSFPVYAASLAILFRWLAKYGKVILPTKKEFEEEFGIRVEERAEGKSVIISSWNDSHPANYWNFTTTKFNTCRDCYDLLKSQNLSREQVLWVRFRKEEPYFNYEKLADFTYHNCCNDESKEIIDKYIKGQDFPVVVIEGFPDKMNYGGSDMEEMWASRREVYLCTSRSTGFLFFISNWEEPTELNDEISRLISSVERPLKPNATTRRIWGLEFKWPDDRLGIPTESIVDVVENDRAKLPAPNEIVKSTPLKLITINTPITIKKLADCLGIQPSELGDDLVESGYKREDTYLIVSDVSPEIACIVAQKRGLMLQINRLGPVSNPINKSVISNQWTKLKENIDRVRWQNAVDKYLSYLSLLYQINPQIAKSAFNRVGTARKRILFSESKSSIVGSLRDGSYSETSVQKIGNSPFYAFVGLDNRSKSKFLDEVMQICTVPVSLRSEVLASFN